MTCEDCGAETKDPFKKCYKCFQKTKKPTTPEPEKKPTQVFKPADEIKPIGIYIEKEIDIYERAFCEFEKTKFFEFLKTNKDEVRILVEEIVADAQSERRNSS